jgi:hypothetical protein
VRCIWCLLPCCKGFNTLFEACVVGNPHVFNDVSLYDAIHCSTISACYVLMWYFYNYNRLWLVNPWQGLRCYGILRSVDWQFCYGRFGTTYRFHCQESKILDCWTLGDGTDVLCHNVGDKTTSLRSVKSQNSEDLIDTPAEAWSHARQINRRLK